MMTIQVRVLSAKAIAELRAVELANKKAAASVMGMGRAAGTVLPTMGKWGNQMQWMGRQLIYNFTLPLALAAGAATKWALDNEKAMIRVEKVYGDGSKRFKQLAKTEIPALADAFEALSNQFGVNQAEVINIGADWAAAGASGIALAKSVKLTLETMVLGEMSAAEATKNLMAIQAQYGQNTKDLTNTIDVLNMVENQTATTMKDLMDSMARSAGVARVAGVEVRELAAMTAALVPSSGSAATAGNALKTIISRILSPTEDAVLLLREMGIEMDADAWKSADATDRIETLSKSFIGLSDAQKVHMSTVLGSRWQLNRLVILMQAVNNENSHYHRALRATSDESAIFAQRQFELNKVLKSNPQMLKQAWVILQNAMTKIIVPIVPHIVYLAQELARLANAFTNLSPEVQKFVLWGLLILAAIGPIARYVGSVTVLIFILSKAFHFLGARALWAAKGIFTFAASLLIAPFKFAIAGVIGLAGAFVGLGSLLFGLFTKAFWGVVLVSPLRFAMLYMVGTAIAGFGGLMVAMRVFAAPWLVMWQVAMLRLQRIWAITMVSLTAIFGAWAGTMAGLMVNVRAAFASIWVGMAMMFQGLWTAMLIVVGRSGALMTAAWALVHNGIALMQMAWGRAMLAISIAFHAAWATTTAAAATAIAQIYLGLRAAVGVIMLGMGHMIVRAALFMTTIVPIIAGAAATLVSLIGAAIMALPGLLASVIPMMLAALASPWVLAGLAILGIVYAFRDKIASAWNSIVEMAGSVPGAIADFFAPLGGFFNDIAQGIVDAFWALPEGIRNAMVAVLTVVRDAALAVYEWMSYLNPFARHSPSLVENVTKGMDVIQSQFSRVRSSGKVFAQAYKQLNAYKKGMGSLGEFADDRKSVAKGGGNLALFDGMIGSLKRLYPMMKRQEAAVAAQERVVDKWSDKLDEATDRLDKLQSAYDGWADQLSNYASAPLKGMGKMQKQIDANTQAQNELNLAIAQWEQANGSVDSLRDRLADLRGDIELMTGRANDLRMQGAGSDILGPIQAQIAAMEAEAKALEGTVRNSPVGQMQTELEQLQKAGEILQLTYDVTFDPLTQQIDRLADTSKELTFEEVVAGMEEARKHMARLEGPLAAATKTHDTLQKKYDKEKESLDELNESYSKTKDVVSELEEALRGMGQTGSDALSKIDAKKKKGIDGALKKKGAGPDPAELANSVKTFRAGKGGNWPDPGSFKKVGREKGMGDQSDMLKKFAERSANQMGNIFGGFDMFGPLKEWWGRTWDWIEENVGPVVRRVGRGIGTGFRAVMDWLTGLPWGKVTKPLGKAWNAAEKVVKKVWGWMKNLWGLFREDVMDIWNELVKAGKRIWNEIGPELAKFAPILKKLPAFFKTIWKNVKPLVQILGGALLLAFKVVANVISQTIGPVLDFIIDIFYAIVQVIRGTIGIIVGVVTGDWKMAWEGLKSIVAGVFNGIWAVIKGFVRIIWGVVQGLVEGIVDFFVWVYDKLVGHSIIPDLVAKIWEIFRGLAKIGKWIWDHVLKPVVDFFKNAGKAVAKRAREWWGKLTSAWKNIKSGTWWKEKVLLPIAVALISWWRKRITWFKDWWKNMQEKWSNIKNGVTEWWKSKVLEPVKRKIGDWWRERLQVWKGWWGDIKNAWSNIRSGEWWKERVMDPIREKVRDGFEKLKEWLQGAKDLFIAPMKGIVNGIIDAINTLITGLNRLSDLPGIEFHIGAIQRFATGTDQLPPKRRVGGGFKTNGARAIVGEGKANYPEYVIPTDPTYRHRARGLLAQAASKIGPGGGFGHMDSMRGHMGQTVNGVRAYALGGWISDVAKGGWNELTKLADDAKGGAGKMASWVMSPFIGRAREAINNVNWNLARQMGHYGLDKVLSFVGLADSGLEDTLKDAEKKYGSGFNKPSNPRGRASWKGGTFSRLFVAAMKAAQKDAGGNINVMQGGFRPTTSYSGTSHAGDALDMQVSYSIGRALRKVGVASGDRTGLGDWAPHIHAIPGPDAGYAAGSGPGQWRDYVARGGINQSMTSPWGLAQGAIIKATRGGVLARVGEGEHDEAVVPLPRGWKNGGAFDIGRGGDTHIHFHGAKLEFPNIKSGDDAEALVDNLTLLAKD